MAKKTKQKNKNGFNIAADYSSVSLGFQAVLRAALSNALRIYYETGLQCHGCPLKIRLKHLAG